LETFEIVLGPAAQRELKKLERRDQLTIVKVLDGLAQNSRPHGVEKLRAHPKFLRISAGKDHRVIYHIFHSMIVVLVIRDRKEAYRSLDDLDGKLAAALRAIEQEAVAQFRASG